MRELDQAECLAMGTDPYTALAQSRERSERSFEVWSPNGELCAEWGYRTRNFLTGEADVWMLSFAPMERNRVWAARVSLALLANLLGTFMTLRAEVHAKHTIALRWLLWLGFTVDDMFPAPTGELFYVMKRGRD